MVLDGKKLVTSNLPFQAYEGFIRTQYFSNPVRAFLENPFFVLWLNVIMGNFHNFFN